MMSGVSERRSRGDGGGDGSSYDDIIVSVSRVFCVVVVVCGDGDRRWGQARKIRVGASNM